MPTYFAMTVQRKTQCLTDDYVDRIYAAIISEGYPFKSGEWFHEDATFDEIVAWNQAKLQQGFQLGFTEHVRNNYMQILFDTPAYSQMRGFWTYSETDIDFNLILPEHDVLNREDGDRVLEERIAPIRSMGVKIWEQGLADVIQTSVEMDYGYYSIDRVWSGENVMAHPFAILPQDVLKRFGDAALSGKELIKIGNNGVLVNSGGYLPAHFLP